MAIHAKAHADRHDLPDLLHILHVAVALLAGDSARDMALVVEIDEVGHHVHVHPLHGLIRSDGFFKLFDMRRIRLHEIVAIHADRDGGHVRMCGAIDAAVTVLALDLTIASVQLVAERDRLRRRIAHAPAGVEVERKRRDR